MADVDAARVGPHEVLVAPDQLVLLGQHDVVAGDAVAHDEVHPEHGEEDGAERRRTGPSLITSSVEKTSWKSTEENQRLSV